MLQTLARFSIMPIDKSIHLNHHRNSSTLICHAGDKAEKADEKTRQVSHQVTRKWSFHGEHQLMKLVAAKSFEFERTKVTRSSSWPQHFKQQNKKRCASTHQTREEVIFSFMIGEEVVQVFLTDDFGWKAVPESAAQQETLEELVNFFKNRHKEESHLFFGG